MRTLKRLIHRAKQLVGDIIGALYDYDEDEFIEAIGLDPKNYEVSLPDGDTAYKFDIVEGLSRIAPDVWAGYKDG